LPLLLQLLVALHLLQLLLTALRPRVLGQVVRVQGGVHTGLPARRDAAAGARWWHFVWLRRRVEG
jgi:hypothetical protein